MATRYNPVTATSIKVKLKPKPAGMPSVGKQEPGAPVGGMVKPPVNNPVKPPAGGVNKPVTPTPVQPPKGGANKPVAPAPKGPQPYEQGPPLAPKPAGSGSVASGGAGINPKPGTGTFNDAGYNPVGPSVPAKNPSNPNAPILTGASNRVGATYNPLGYGGTLNRPSPYGNTNVTMPGAPNGVGGQNEPAVQGQNGGAGNPPAPGNGTFNDAGYKPVGQTVGQGQVKYSPPVGGVNRPGKPHIVQPPNGPQPYEQGPQIGPRVGGPKNGQPVLTGATYNPPSGLKVVPAPYKFSPPPDLAGVYGSLDPRWQADMQTWDPTAAAAFLRAWAAGDYAAAEEWHQAAWRSRDQLNAIRQQYQDYNASLMQNYNRNKPQSPGQPAPVGPTPYDANNPITPTPQNPEGGNAPVQLDDQPTTWTRSDLAELAIPPDMATLFNDVYKQSKVSSMKDTGIDLTAASRTNAKPKAAKKKNKNKPANNGKGAGWLVNPPQSGGKKNKQASKEPERPVQPGSPDRPYRNRRVTRNPLGFGGQLKV